MPYGPTTYQRSRVRSYIKRGSNARSAKIAYTRKTNLPVKRIQRKRYVPKIVKNTHSISVLAKQVKRLQGAQLGPYQSLLQTWSLPVPRNNQWSQGWSSRAPLIFALNDFTTDAKVHQAYFDNLSGNLTEGQEWTNKSTPTEESDNWYWAASQDNTVSREQYKPLSTTVSFEFTRDMYSNDETECVRIDIFKLKRTQPLSYADATCSLPGNAAGLERMCDKNMANRNFFNPKYFTKIQTKLIYFKPREGLGTASAKIRRTCKIFHNFKDKVLRLDLDAPTASGRARSFETQMNKQDTIWCLISNSAADSNADFDCTMQRRIAWRDQHGTD